MDAILSGQIKAVDGEWYYTEYQVSYSQQGVRTSDSYVTQEEAEEGFTKRLNDARQCWGHNGARYSEQRVETRTGYAVKFQSIRKNGKAGTLKGSLHFSKLSR